MLPDCGDALVVVMPWAACGAAPERELLSSIVTHIAATHAAAAAAAAVAAAALAVSAHCSHCSGNCCSCSCSCSCSCPCPSSSSFSSPSIPLLSLFANKFLPAPAATHSLLASRALLMLFAAGVRRRHLLVAEVGCAGSVYPWRNVLLGALSCRHWRGGGPGWLDHLPGEMHTPPKRSACVASHN